MSEKPLLGISRLRVSYGAIQALKGISLTVQAGEIVALLGANGAGKSTLLKAIMQTVPIASGEILFKGQNLRLFSTETIVSKGIAIAPEGRGILGSLSVLENLQLGAYHQSHWEEDLSRVFELFPLLKDRLNQRGGTLSGGEQQMLAIGRALLSRPQLLLLDEPSLGLAPKIIQNIFRLIKTIRDTGISILLIEQNAPMALKVADRVYVLETGSVAITGTPAQMSQNEDLKKAYLGG